MCFFKFLQQTIQLGMHVQISLMVTMETCPNLVQLTTHAMKVS
jgi:hypothetical protein